MHRKGFALLEIAIVVVVIVAIVAGGFYVAHVRTNTNAPQGEQSVAENASGTAPSTVADGTQSSASATLPSSSSTSTSMPMKSSSMPSMNSANSMGANQTTPVTTASTVTVADALEGLGGDIYANGILPLGDGKYTTTAPKKGYVYLCNVAAGGEGAETNGPWVGTSTWNLNGKIAVEGSVSWPNAAITINVSGTTRTIVTNDLPVGGTTGIFPIQSTDPAYQYDGNPNSIEAQDLTFSLPANPQPAATPQCIYGEVGVMTNGVLLLDAFDAEYRDAEAHEIQDSCQGHPHMDGLYHYHSLSSCISDATVTNIIGWAFDGYPITGPEISTGKYLTTADLDECHGITSPVMENGVLVDTYHYVMTEDFPYSISCFHGTSYEPKPGADGMNMSGMGSSGAPQSTSTQSGGTPPTPPQAAITACDGKSSGATCTVGQNTTGVCTTIGTSFACKPN